MCSDVGNLAKVISESLVSQISSKYSVLHYRKIGVYCKNNWSYVQLLCKFKELLEKIVVLDSLSKNYLNNFVGKCEENKSMLDNLRVFSNSHSSFMSTSTLCAA